MILPETGTYQLTLAYNFGTGSYWEPERCEIVGGAGFNGQPMYDRVCTGGGYQDSNGTGRFDYYLSVRDDAPILRYWNAMYVEDYDEALSIAQSMDSDGIIGLAYFGNRQWDLAKSYFSRESGIRIFNIG